jgi:adenylate cyclase
MAVFLFFDRFLFIEKGVWLNATYPLLTLFSAYISTTVYNYVTVEKEKRRIKGAFRYYVTESVMEEILRRPEKLALGGEEKELSVLFSDIRGFATISEKLPPGVLVGLLNGYLTRMTEVVFRYDGYLDKYIGDAIMAVYGAPVEREDHALSACRTAVEMIASLKGIQIEWERAGLPKIDIGIGINTGKMVVGNMGSRKRFNYTVVGDNVNLASRLEGLTKRYEAPIIIGEGVYERVKGELLCRELDSVRVKGKEVPTRVYELIGRGSGEDMEFVDRFRKALDSYRAMMWKEADALFKKALELRPNDRPSMIYIERCGTYLESPPSQPWDWVTEISEK